MGERVAWRIATLVIAFAPWNLSSSGFPDISAHRSVTVRTGDANPESDEAIARLLSSRTLLIPVQGVSRATLRDTFAERRGLKLHDAIDIAAPRGTPVVATDDGRVVKLFRSVAGGLTVYQFDRDERVAYYYAHLGAYAKGLHEGATLKRGELIGYVGSTGNASYDAPHLHFTIYRLGSTKEWWKGVSINPYPFLTEQ